jgi:protein-disulfide isomerase
MTSRIAARAGGLLVAAFLLGMVPPAPRAEEPPPLTPEEVEQFRKVIRDYLLSHPEVIVEAINELEKRDLAAAADAQRQTIAERHAELFEDSGAPIAGKPDGSVTIVEFFDYKCPYCKGVAPDLMKTIDADGDVRLVFKEFPILGPQSVHAAKAALAANRQGKYLEFHEALMGVKGDLDEATVFATAKSVGLDVERLKADMEAPEIAAAIDRNHALAAALRINGTPAFVVGDEVIPGAIPMDEMKKLIEAARSS